MSCHDTETPKVVFFILFIFFRLKNHAINNAGDRMHLSFVMNDNSMNIFSSSSGLKKMCSVNFCVMHWINLMNFSFQHTKSSSVKDVPKPSSTERECL